MRQIAIAASLLGASLMACAPTPNETQGDRPVVNQGLPPPTPQDIAVRIGAAAAGQRVEVRVNERFAVELVGVPTAGYIWAPAQMPPFITRAGEASGPTIPEQNQPGYAGGNHWEVLMFVATGPGEGELVLEQRRPWETDEPPANAFRVTVVAR